MIKKLLIIITIFICTGCKQTGVATRIKHVIKIEPMETKYIELEDGSRYGMGENLYNRLVTQLTNSNRYLVLVDENLKQNFITQEATQNITINPSDTYHFDFPPLASANFSANINGLNFSHGSRGMHRFSGFTPDFQTPWNNGNFTSQNEFPQRPLLPPMGWFENTFDPIGNDLDNTITGVDAGEEGEFNILIASLYYRRDSFAAQANINTNISMIQDEKIYQRALTAKGTGFLFAMGGNFLELNANFIIAKRDTMEKTFNNAITAMIKEIDNRLLKTDFRTRIEIIEENGIFINAGQREGIQAGDIFLHKRNGAVNILQVVESYQIGSLVKKVSGPGDIQVYDTIVLDEKLSDEKQKKSLSPSIKFDKIPENGPSNKMLYAQQNTIIQEAPKTLNLDQPELNQTDANSAYALSVKDTVFLPYNLYRWALYDQSVAQINFLPSEYIQNKIQSQWNTALVQTTNAWKQLNNTNLGAGVKIAIIDSGVDYNHANLGKSFQRNYTGWDYMSFDERPFDDNSHGTAIAGLISAQGILDQPVGIAPNSTLLSYKVFNPYGETTSAAIYAAFERAIADGVQIIVCAWNTQIPSTAIQQAIILAEKNNILVVTAAGDRGENLEQVPQYPAVLNAHTNIITVAALNQSQNLSTLFPRRSNFSQQYVDIAAPGESLQVLAPRNEYLVRSGSDLAAAHVAGAAALILSAHKTATAAQVKQWILNGADHNQQLVNQIANARQLNIDNALRLSGQ